MQQKLSDVRAYYERNTEPFLSSGQGADAIHRAVWAPGVTTRAAALRVVDERVLAAIRSLRHPEPLVVDVGCGVGSSLLWLSERVGLRGAGVTLSPLQARRFAEEIERRGLSGRLESIEGSFTALPPGLTHIDVAFAVESFVHSPSVDAFLSGLKGRIARGGLLLVCDDFLERPPAGKREEQWLRDIAEGWLMRSLVSRQELIAAASSVELELVGDEDWTRFLELGRPRDRLVALTVLLGRPFKPKSWLYRSWVGGAALQRALRAGFVGYRWLSFRQR